MLIGSGGKESTEKTPLVALHVGTNDPARTALPTRNEAQSKMICMITISVPSVENTWINKKVGLTDELMNYVSSI